MSEVAPVSKSTLRDGASEQHVSYTNTTPLTSGQTQHDSRPHLLRQSSSVDVRAGSPCNVEHGAPQRELLGRRWRLEIMQVHVLRARATGMC